MKVFLDIDNNPHIECNIISLELNELTCLIDTGFTGGIALPQKYLSKIKGTPYASVEFRLADGSIVKYNTYKAIVGYNSCIKVVTLIFTNSTRALVGIDFLEGFKFVLDLKKLRISLN